MYPLSLSLSLYIYIYVCVCVCVCVCVYIYAGGSVCTEYAHAWAKSNEPNIELEQTEELPLSNYFAFTYNM
jgi:hypothetical protein